MERQTLSDFGKYAAECMPKYIQKVNMIDFSYLFAKLTKIFIFLWYRFKAMYCDEL